MVAHGEPRPLKEFWEQFAKARQQSSTRSPPTVAVHDLAALLAERPWLAEYVRSGTSTQHNEALRPDEAEPPMESEMAVDMAWHFLEASRMERDSSTSHRAAEDFVTVFRDGMWNMVNRDINESDRVIAQAKKGTPIHWSSLYKLGKMASFSESKYGREGSSALALQWCRRLQHFYDIWCKQDDPKYIYTPEDIASYQEDPAWTLFWSTVPANGPLRDRAEAIRALVP
jgi:hypothetical protein